MISVTNGNGVVNLLILSAFDELNQANKLAYFPFSVTKIEATNCFRRITKID